MWEPVTRESSTLVAMKDDQREYGDQFLQALSRVKKC